MSEIVGRLCREHRNIGSAVGVKSKVLDGSGPSRVGLNVKSDAMWVRTESNSAEGLQSAEGDVTRLRRILEGHQRITATFRRADGATLHVRKATRAEPSQQAIYDALGIDPAPGGIRKTVV